MRAFVLQDWVTIRGGSTITTVVQNENSYLTLDAYQDAFFWLQVAELTTGSGTITLNYETSPLKDETLFYATQAISLTSVQMTPPSVTGVTLYGVTAGATTHPPLARFVRWHLLASATATWDITFRILVTANQNWVSQGGAGMGGGWPGGGMMR
jgi:hypothetical protein